MLLGMIFAQIFIAKLKNYKVMKENMGVHSKKSSLHKKLNALTLKEKKMFF